MAKLQPVVQQLPLRELFANPTVATMAAHMQQSLSLDRPATEPTTLIRLQPKGTDAPLICLPGAGG